ncbi:MAG: Uncharacterized protein XD63_0668 [Thermoanaerobacterales bacterium 50_218]|nr:MAG: Uncharacterized protein XD63_0668 [Thermoanaerobacterales bacterium 50_218]
MIDTVRKPPEGRFSPDLKTGSAWCPYCSGVKDFVWDAQFAVSRCPTCGTSSEDFWLRVCNSGTVKVGRTEHKGLCSDAGKARFDAAVRESGRAPTRTPKPEQPEPEVEADASIPGRGRNKSSLPLTTCPVCGRELAAYPGKATCPRCLAPLEVSRNGEVRALEDGRLRCPLCASSVADSPEPGKSYMCTRCGVWVKPDGSVDVGSTEKARKKQPARSGNPEPFPAEASVSPVLKEVPGKPESGAWAIGDDWVLWTESPAGAEAARELGLREMAVHAGNGRAALQFAGPPEAVKQALRAAREDGRVLIAESFETKLELTLDVPPAPPKGAKEEQPGRTVRQPRLFFEPEGEDQKSDSETRCDWCKKMFTRRNNFAKYCSEACRRAAEREKKRLWKRKRSAAK